jgi:hypothetical protein
MKFNQNFLNEFYITIPKENRSDALSLLKKMSDNLPGVMHKASMKIKDEIQGGIVISITNTSEIPDIPLAIIKKYLYSIARVKFVRLEE